MERQKEILRTFQGDTKLIQTKAEIIKKGNIGYYHNTMHHAGETLSRMVKNNNLKRISKGKYMLGSGNKQITQPKEQTKLEL